MFDRAVFDRAVFDRAVFVSIARRRSSLGRLSLASVLVLFALVAAACSSGTGAGTATPSTNTATPANGSDTSPNGAVPAEITATFDEGDCEFMVQSGFDATCGSVVVPQRWDDATDPDTISLHVATFTNEQTPSDAIPVVYLEGGPGGDAFAGLELALGEQWGDLINAHPLVVFSQRGSSLSTVDLVCEEVIDESLASLERSPDAEADVAAQEEALGECIQRTTDEGADLTAYNTVFSANDAEAVRRALGIDEWHIFGISYGTRLGQELLRTHPNAIVSAVLDSVQPTDPALGSLAAVPRTFEGALDRFYAGCAESTECAADFPDLEDRLRAVIDQLAAEPVEVEALNQLDGQSYDAIIDDARLSGIVFNALYSPAIFGALPTLVEELEAGETATLSTLVGLQVTNAEFISNGQFSAVICHDYNPAFVTQSDLDAGLTGDAFFDETFAQSSNGLESLRSTCDLVGSGAANEVVTELVESDIPTLLLSGEYDPITPPSFADAIAPGLANHQNVVHPNQGHAVTTDECGLQIALDFLADPSSNVDTSCLDDSVPPPFSAPDLANIALEPFRDADLGISGVRPRDWFHQGFGASVQDDANIADQLVLLQQAAPVSPAQVIELLGQQLDTELTSAGGTSPGGRVWDISEGSSSIGDVRLWTREDSGATLAVALIGSGDSFDDAEQHIIADVLTNIRVG